MCATTTTTTTTTTIGNVSTEVIQAIAESQLSRQDSGYPYQDGQCDMCHNLLLWDTTVWIQQYDENGCSDCVEACPMCAATNCRLCHSCDELATRCVDDDSGNAICPECIERYYRQCNCRWCDDSDAFHHEDSMTTIHDIDEQWCEDCVDSYSHSCDDCGNTICHDGGDSNITLCEECRSNYYSCQRCDYLMHNESDELCNDEDGNVYCDSCYHELYRRCDSCWNEIDVDTQCSDCDCGECCCECSMSGDNEDMDDVPNYDSVVGDILGEWKLSNRTYGIEIECCGREYDSLTNGLPFSSTYDPSCGAEYVSGILQGTSGLNAIKTMMDRAKEEHTVDSNCGMHVHFGAKDLSWKKLRKVMLLWATLQEWTYSVVSPSRRRIHYSEPNNWNKDTIGKLNSTKRIANYTYNRGTTYDNPSHGYDVDAEDVLKRDRYNGARYCGLNLCTWFYRGTIEFRTHQGTLNPTKAINWIIYLDCLIDFAIHNEDRFIESIDDGILLLELCNAPSATIEYFKARKEYFANRS